MPTSIDTAGGGAASFRQQCGELLLVPFRAFTGLRGSGVVRRLLTAVTPSVVATTASGFRMRLDLRDDMQWTLYLRGQWESAEVVALASVLKPGATFYDIGANVGFHTLLAARAVGPTGAVVAFEPMRATRQMLRDNIGLNRLANVTIVEQGLSDRPEVVTAAFQRHETGMASIREVRDPGHTEPIALVRGDALAIEAGLPAPDVIKIDVEGAEYKALAGMGELLRSVSAVLIEITPPYLEELGASAEALRGLLAGHGLSESRLVSRIRCWDETGRPFEQTNELFTRPVADTP